MRNPSTPRLQGFIAGVACLALAFGGLSGGQAAAETTWDPAPGFTSTDGQDSTYTVPLFNADVPDISVLRVPASENDEGRDLYYMVSTTMHLSPGAPIMKSYDLVNWEIVNYVFNRGDLGDGFSLRNGANSYGQGQWASSLRYHDGQFYVLFNTNNLGGAYIYSTDDIEQGAWERTALGRAFHDGSLFFDETDGGTPYIFYGSGSVNAVQLNADLTKVVAEFPDIVRPADYPGASFLGGLFEGTQVFYIDGHYYLVLITWPSGQGRQVVMFRGDELLGRHATGDGSNPYEARSALNSNGFAQGSLMPVRGEDGTDTWHGIFFRDTFPTGRVPALIPATWSDGWPTFGINGKVAPGDSFPKPIALTPDQERRESLRSIVASDDFDNDAAHRAWSDEEWAIPEAPELDESLIGVELIDNGSFDGGVEGWAGSDTAKIGVTTDAATGTGALAVTGRTTTGSGPLQDVTASMQKGVTYKASVKVRYDASTAPATKDFLVTARYGGSSYTNLGRVTATRGQWATIQATFTVPEPKPSRVELFVETPWTATPSATTDLMDFRIDDFTLIGQPATAEPASEAEVAYNGSDLDPRWQWNHAPDNRYWSLTDRDGWLRLTAGKVLTGNYRFTRLGNQPGLTYLEEARNTLSQRIFGPESSYETRIDFTAMKDGDRAGLALYNRGFSYIGVNRADGKTTLGLVNRMEPFAVNFDRAAVESFVPGTSVDLAGHDDVYLKADADLTRGGQLWTTFSYSFDGFAWTQLGSAQGPQALDGSLSHFMGHRVGLFNYATETAGGAADFDYFFVSDKRSGVETEALDAAISEAKRLSQSDYEIDVWADLQDALAKAEQAKAKGAGTQNQADAPERELSEVLAEMALQKKSEPSPSPSPSVSSPTPDPTGTATPPKPSATAKPSATTGPSTTGKPTPAKPTSAPSTASKPAGDLYTTPGYHLSGGRRWFTTCEPYSQTMRCRTQIWATTVVRDAGRFVQRDGWVFNNLTYLPHMIRAQWAGNPLGEAGSWTDSAGRRWLTECDTPVTGRNGCRTWVSTDVVAAVTAGDGSVSYRQREQMVFNNLVRFR